MASRLIEQKEEFLDKKRFYGVFRGIVEYNEDPLMLGRVKARVPLVYGTRDEVDYSAIPWAWTIQNQHGGTYDQGSFLIPDVGAAVLVVFEGGDPRYPLVLGTYPSFPVEESDCTECGKSESPIETQAPIDDVPETMVPYKSDFSILWDQHKSKMKQLILEHFPDGEKFKHDQAFGLKAVQKDVGGQKITEIKFGNEDRFLRLSRDAFSGMQLKSDEVIFDITQEGEEVKLTLFGTHLASLFIDKSTGELKLSFKKVTIASDLEISGNCKVLGTILGG